jgi:hypothetical protein
VSPLGGALTGAGLLCRRLSRSRLGGRPLRGGPLRGGPLGRRLLRRSFLRGPRLRRFGVTDYSRDAVSEGGGVLLDEFACCAVTCSALVGGLGHLPSVLLAQPSVSQVLLNLLRAHQSFVPFFRDRYDRPSVTTRGVTHLPCERRRVRASGRCNTRREVSPYARATPPPVSRRKSAFSGATRAARVRRRLRRVRPRPSPAGTLYRARCNLTVDQALRARVRRCPPGWRHQRDVAVHRLDRPPCRCCVGCSRSPRTLGVVL